MLPGGRIAGREIQNGLQLRRFLSCIGPVKSSSPGGKPKEFRGELPSRPCFSNNTFLSHVGNFKATRISVRYSTTPYRNVRNQIAYTLTPDSNDMSITLENVLALEALEAKLRAMLPEQYRDSYEQVV